MQFRCAGSVEFVAWIDSFLRVPQSGTRSSEGGLVVAETAARAYRVRSPSPGAPDEARMTLQVFESPDQLEAALRARQSEGNSVRLVSSFSRRWKTIDAANPHELAAELMDFHEPYPVDGVPRLWNRVWNVLGPRKDYTWYVSAHPAGRIRHDPLCEVGCPYVVRGFDYDYVGVLWLNDLIWRGHRWQVDANAVQETGLIDLVRAARRELARTADGPATSRLLQHVMQTYRILFTRAFKGIYVWVPDPETRAHLISAIVER